MSRDLSKAVKSAFKALGKSVCVLSYQDQETRAASVATAVCNISEAPPSLLLCVEKTASFAALLGRDSKFTVNVLGAEQQDIMQQVATTKGEQRFELGSWQQEQDWLLLQESQANFLCKVSALETLPSHLIIIADIEDVHSEAQPSALIYLGGQFRTLAAQ
jgi:flavin reductase (DIM6/NTAB) family NADH-FMN oxidoreductase RutF